MEHLTLPDGRTLDISLSGPEGGDVMVFHHGTPGSLHASHRLESAAHAAGLRVLTYSRAGYGGSTPHPGRRVVDIAGDVAAMLDHVGADRCVVAGWSGGGPHCLATAARLSERVDAALVIAGVAPYDADGLDFLAGMGEDNVEEFGAAVEGEAALRAYLEPYLPQLRAATPQDIITSLSSLLPDVDRAVITERTGQDLARNFHEALRVGYEGWLEDDLAFTQPWGFDLAEVTVPTYVWQGSLDLMVPFAHGQWLAEHLPRATAHLIGGEGHLSIGDGRAAEMMAELAAAARA
ncbi:alpha/beta fold hydrolase [Luteipulveratus halotolerans]|uniref:Alpha/beta hydrolase n=1 Tax=Luteipulveratus halotolerans TaxID=1631356 RepID=A0A0L6CFX2_9MICO|nr:alpha/beta hydrolase [Luteipulveratus halotolerans]KNX36697.1 alpha/beta hydrolase [Luteipulveratus halotolerans]